MLFLKPLLKKVFLGLLFLSFFSSFSQDNKLIDSLKIKNNSLQDTLLVDNLDKLAWEYKNINKDSAMFYAKKALNLAKKLNNKSSIANSYNTIGSNFEYVSNLDSAFFYYEKSLSIKFEIKDSIGIANSYNNLGIIKDEKGDYLKAIEYYFKALKIYQSNKSSADRIPMVLVNIGIVYKKQKKYKKVLKYYEDALEIYKDLKNNVGIVITTGNIGSVLLSLKKFNESISYSKKAKKMYSDLGYTRYIPYMDHQIAKAMDSLKDFKKSNKLYINIINKFKKDNNTFELLDAKISLANNYYFNKSFKKAKETAYEALKSIRKNNFKELEVRILECLSKVLFETKDYKDAFLINREYVLKKDKVFELEKTKSIFELETKYQTEKKEKELLLTKAEKVTTELKLNNQKQLNYTLFGGLAILLLAGFSIFQRNKRKHELTLANQKEQNLQSIIFAEEKERTKIARDLHDGIVQQIGATILKSRNIFDKLGLSDKDESKQLLANLEVSNKELREISHQMMPRALEEAGLITALENLFLNSLLPSEIKYEFEHINIINRLPKNIEITLYRITQELINNILKHSKASEVNIQLFKTETDIVYMLEDNGTGFSSTKKEGIGLKNIKSRIDLIKGFVNINSENSGTLTTIKIPL
ncbi:MAG: sensor histidine kinase [Polaribacter sp.]